MPTQLWMTGPLLLAVAISQSACDAVKKTEGKPAEEAASVKPALFEVPQDQMAHLKVVPVESRTWQVAVHTTGTVDWDADHTTQAITQVNGPITRIMVDTGNKVKEGEPLLYVSSPDVANAGARRRGREGRGERRGRLQRRHDRRPNHPASLADLRHHPARD
jgi:multidrug efflux pump subunit AcrA (membrane-fusion protein)